MCALFPPLALSLLILLANEAVLSTLELRETMDGRGLAVMELVCSVPLEAEKTDSASFHSDLTILAADVILSDVRLPPVRRSLPACEERPLAEECRLLGEILDPRLPDLRLWSCLAPSRGSLDLDLLLVR